MDRCEIRFIPGLDRESVSERHHDLSGEIHPARVSFVEAIAVVSDVPDEGNFASSGSPEGNRRHSAALACAE